MTGYDAFHCPDCAAPLHGAGDCPACGLPLRGPLAIELWRVLQEIDRLHMVRRSLLGRMRAEAAHRAPGMAASTMAPPAAAPVRVQAPVHAPAPTPLPPRTRSTAAPAARVAAPKPRRPRREWTPQRVQNVILLTGVLVTLVAAVIFTAFQWGGLPIWARGAFMAGATAAAGYGARYVDRRGLRSSAEAIGGLTVLLGAVDAYALHRVGFRALEGGTYWPFATAALAAGAAGFARVVPVRSVRYLALGLAQMPVFVVAWSHDGWSAASHGLLFGIQAAALVVGARYLHGLANAARACAAATWGLGLMLALSVAYGTGDVAEVPAAAATVAALGLVPLLWQGVRDWSAAVATAALVVAALSPARLELTFVQIPAAVAAVGLLAVVAAALLPREWRDGPAVVGAVTVGLAATAVAPHVVTALLAPFTWVGDDWSVAGDPAARAVLSPDYAWGGSVVVAGVALATAAAAAVAGGAFTRRAVPFAAVSAALAVAVVPLAFAWSYRGALAWDVAAGAAALAGAVVTRRAWLALPGCVLLAVAAGWSLANDAATVGVLAAVTVAFGAFAAFMAREEAASVAGLAAAGLAVAFPLSRGVLLDRTGFVLAATAASLLGAAALFRLRYLGAVAAASYALALAFAVTDPGWLAWTLALGTAVTVAVTATRLSFAPVPAVLGLACAGVAAAALGAPLGRNGFVLAVAAAVVLGAGVLLRDRIVQGIATAGYGVALALALAANDAGWLAWTLALGAVVTAGAAVLDRGLAPVPAVLALAATSAAAVAFGTLPDRHGFVLAVAAAVVLGAGVLLRDRIVQGIATAGYAAGVGLAASGPGWLAWTLALGAVVTAAAAVRDRRFAAVSAVLGLATTAATAVAFGAPREGTGFVVAVAAAVVLGAAALLRDRATAFVATAGYVTAVGLASTDPGWLAWTLAIGTVVSAVAAVVDLSLVRLSAALALATTVATEVAFGAPTEVTGFVLAVAAAAVLGVAVLLRDDDVEYVSLAGYGVALALAAADPRWLSWTFALGGVATLANATRPERRNLVWAGGLLLTFCTWVRLGLADVGAPEAYTVPLAALSLAFGHVRRVRDERVGSWSAYGGGLSLAFGPSLWMVLTEQGLMRPLLLALAAMLVLFAGIGERLQAPLTVGAVVLVTDALVQLAPVAAAAPKWASLGTVGLLVIAVGVTYEDRRRDVERLRRTLDSMV